MSAEKMTAPSINPINPGSLAPVKSIVLGNGIPVHIIEGGTEDVMRIEFILRAGTVMENIPLQASSTNMMLTEGSEKYSSEEIKALLDGYGVFYQLSAERDSAGLIIYLLNRHAEKAIELIAEILFNSMFPEKEFVIMMKKRLRRFMISREKVQTLASEKFFETIFGNNHPYGKMVSENDFEALNTDHLKNFYASYYTPANLSVIVSGKINENIQEIMDKYLGSKLPGTPLQAGNESDFQKCPQKRIHVPKKGALQSAIRIGSATINKRHPDYPGLKVLNTILGGYFGSRLMKNIREEKGYTYGIRSVAASLNLSGYKIISAEVDNQSVREAIAEIYREISKLQKEPVAYDELELVRNYMAGEMVRMFDGPFSMAESFRAIWEFNLEADYYRKLAHTVRTITPDELLHLANKYYNIDELYEIVAG
ncbi:MAG TPA: pitrilysin family protein [Bacteroidales bacterium]|nr:hypothetical protein [Bacteroidales bacterium]HNR42521.1 pitrilysin family protein [Bacteroidales bacterium]HPM17965.1 pitrilysin family protein [Bacteroidales bacterium]HQG76223.1 pitrilysin family protein [Bacteroidales bacterium]